jgi:FMN hydrolase / 5-amino-6-(5-phospho-D-ribitylamino)uracil phosphatase
MSLFRHIACPPNVIRALTLDLDDTLWAITPVIEAAERALHAHLEQHCPQVCERFPLAAMRALRERVASENPHLAHDYSAQRRMSLAIALAEGGADPALAESAFDAFIAARNRVELYADVADALPRLRRRRRLAALTNGNADLALIGLQDHFEFSLAAREHGEAKPAASIFLAACSRLDCAPHEVLHVGDDPWLDVAGAAAAGMPSVWVNRGGQPWPDALPRPDLEVTDLNALADWLESGQSPLRRTA